MLRNWQWTWVSVIESSVALQSLNEASSIADVSELFQENMLEIMPNIWKATQNNLFGFITVKCLDMSRIRWKINSKIQFNEFSV